MFTMIAAWPIWAQLVLALAVVVGAIVISRLGNMFIHWGWFKIGFGRRPKARSCKDCATILMGKAVKYFSHVMIKRNVLEEQMTFASHKLDGIQLKLIQDHRTALAKARAQPTQPDLETENIEYVLVKELSSNATDLVKKEIRRSFKENGFPQMTGREFSDYVKDETSTIIGLLTRYIMDSYPLYGMMVPLTDLLSLVNRDYIEDIIFEIYSFAKQVKNTSLRAIEEDEKKLAADIDEFIKAK